MRTLYLLRHSLTEANERRLYCGWTDLPLSMAGRELALRSRAALPLLRCQRCYTSGLLRTDETLRLLTGAAPDAALPDLREMNFGDFELHGYDELREITDYVLWITDETGDVRCPGGESKNEFRARVLRGGRALLDGDWASAVAVLHGGVIACLMAEWFPSESRGFYDWQPAPCGGWRVAFSETTPVCFDEL